MAPVGEISSIKKGITNEKKKYPSIEVELQKLG